MNGCLNPQANNYNSEATVDDFSCVYVIPDTSGNCQFFKDVLPETIEDQSFTLSYSILGNCWVFFHDYFPDLYINTHKALYALKDNNFFKTNAGPPGVYTDGVPKSFFIDLIFTSEVRRTLGMVSSDYFKGSGDMLLKAVQWVTEFIENGTEQTYQTLTHLSVWNSSQHSGRIPLAQAFERLAYPNMRRTQGNWSMNNFRDLLQSNGEQFLLDMFNNFTLNPAIVPAVIPWYNKKTMIDQWFCVRFEFDNTSQQQMMLHDMIVEVIKTSR